MQLDINIAGPLEPDRLRDAVHTVAGRHPNLSAKFIDQYDRPVQIITAEPAVAWQYTHASEAFMRSRVSAVWPEPTGAPPGAA